MPQNLNQINDKLFVTKIEVETGFKSLYDIISNLQWSIDIEFSQFLYFPYIGFCDELAIPDQPY